ncbi:MAG: peptidase [Myxococcota bacterium]
MTFCLGMKLKDGLVALADTRITSGVERSTARKVTVHQHGEHSLFVMTSGLRSVRDKALTYFTETMTGEAARCDRLYKAVNAFAGQVRRVEIEDGKALRKSKLRFDLYTLIGGQLESDVEHQLFLIYPEGNWVEIGPGTPYSMIGESLYAKPLIDRALHYEDSLERALRIAYLGFDATRVSAVDVDFPIDVVVYRANSYVIHEERFQAPMLAPLSDFWMREVRALVDRVPSDALDAMVRRLDESIKNRNGSGSVP